MKKLLPTLVICILIGVLGTIFFRTYVVKYSYSAERADLNAYYEVTDENDYPVILQDQFSDYHVRKIGESYYLDLASLRELVNDRFYYSEEDMTLNYCLPDTRITAKEGSDTRQRDQRELRDLHPGGRDRVCRAGFRERVQQLLL